MKHTHRWSEPDWSIISQHLTQYFCEVDGDYARVVTQITRFSCLSDALRTTRMDKVHFESIDHIPPCIKYKPPSSLQFVDRTSSTWPGKLVVLKVNIMSLVQLDYDHFLDLHPVRYDKVKEAIAQGEIDMPIVSICSERFPRVGDGRHRIIALNKFGVGDVEILVPEDESAEILRQLNQKVIRKGKAKPTGIGVSAIALEDFCADYTANDDV